MTNLEPGRELDAWLAVKLFGCYVRKNGRQRFSLVTPNKGGGTEWTSEAGAWSAVPEFSTTWEGMRLACEWLERNGWRWSVSHFPQGGAIASVWHDETLQGEMDVHFKHAPGAVALAAKAAIGGDDAHD